MIFKIDSFSLETPQILVNEIQVENIPEVATVANWITQYTANLRKLSAQRIEESNSTRNSREATDIDEGEEVSNNNEQSKYVEAGSQETTVSSNKECNVYGRGKKFILDNIDNNEHSIKRQKK